MSQRLLGTEDRHGAAGKERGSSRTIVLLLCCHVLLFGIGIATKPHMWLDDPTRFHDIATSTLTPYREQPIEYMPLELLGVMGIGARSLNGTILWLGLAALAGDIMSALGVAYGWGRRATVAYLAACLPMLPFLYFRFDLVVVALATWGFALAVRERERSAGLLLGLSIMGKVWPAVLVPTLLPSRKRCVIASVAFMLIGTIAWVAIAGRDAPRQVVTYRGATGWDVNSTVGGMVWVVTGEEPRMEAGTSRVGSVTDPERAFLILVLLGLLLAIYRSAWRGSGQIGAGPALAAVFALLICSPVFGLQYVSWLLPWTAVSAVSALRTERRLAIVGIAVLALTGFQALALGLDLVDTVGSSAVGVRNVLCLFAPIMWITTTWSIGRRRVSDAGPLVSP